MLKAKSKNKINLVIFFILLALLWFIFAFNTANADMIGYKTYYKACLDNDSQAALKFIEVGYVYLLRACKFIGLNYSAFHVLVATIITGTVGWFIFKFADNPAYTLGLYAIYPFFLDAVQLRNSLGMACVLIGFARLLDSKCIENRKRTIIEFIIWVIVASLFHRIMIVYLLYLLVFINERLLTKIAIAGMIIEILIFRYLKQIMAFVFRDNTRFTGYFGSDAYTRPITKVILVSFALGMMILFYLLEKIEKTTEQNHMHKIGLGMTKVSALFMGVFFIEMDFFRIYRNIMIILFVIFINCIQPLSQKYRKAIYVITLLFTIALGYLFVIRGNVDVIDMLKNNLILNKLNPVL